jgi:hypothetical protein
MQNADSAFAPRQAQVIPAFPERRPKRPAPRHRRPSWLARFLAKDPWRP